MAERTEPPVRQADEPELLEAEPIPPVEAGRARGPMAPGGRPDPADIRRAWMVALAADLLQWVLFPLILGGAAAANVGIDLLVAFLLVRWMGWHVAFLPAFITELIPIANFVPSWTLAMWIVTRMRGSRA